MNTQCKPVSTECNLRFGAGTPWDCGVTWQGQLGGSSPEWRTAWFPDSAMSTNDTQYGVPNPYYYGYAGIVGAGVQGSGLIQTVTDPEIVSVVHGGIAFILLCEVTHYDIEYDSVNGTVTRFVATASNESVANIWQVPPGISGDHTAPSLLQAADLAIFSNSAQDLADKMGLAYSRAALAIGAQSVMRTPALAVQQRKSFIVARVPAAPLFTLVAANVLFAIAGVVLTGIAFTSSRRNQDVREVQSRFNIVGLVANNFEDMANRGSVKEMDEYFEEKKGHGSKRIGLVRNRFGGYSYEVAVRTQDGSVGAIPLNDQQWRE